MATFVLVHGAWSGAHTWHRLRPILASSGHEVFTPSMTGLGERRHLAGPQVNLETHVTDVVNHLFHEDLTNVVLVGHSYGGMVITGVIEQCAERLQHVVYLDAFVPDDGQSLYDITGAQASEVENQDWQIPPIPRVMADKTEEAWVAERRVPQPRLTFTGKATVTIPLEKRPFGRTYIKATADPREAASATRSGFWRAADRVRNDPNWRYREIDTTHMVQNEKPIELAQLLYETLS